MGYGLDVLVLVVWCHREDCVFVEPYLLGVVGAFGLEFLVWVVES